MVGRVWPRHRHRGRPLNSVVRRPMTFALEMDTGALWAFSSPEEAMTHCEKHDVAEGGWSFFDENGRPLEPAFGPRRYLLGMKIDLPEYTLDSSMVGAGPSLAARLSEVRSIEHGPFTSVAEVQEHLARAQRRE